MPGLVGLLHKEAALTRTEQAIHKMMHFDFYASEVRSLSPKLALGQVWRRPKYVDGSWSTDDGSGVSVFVNGSVIDLAGKFLLTADQVRDHYVRDTFAPQNFDGSFVIAVHDERTGHLHVYNDVLGTLAVYYSANESGVCFSSEVKSLFAAIDTPPAYSREGIASFMSNGYCLDKTTLFEGVNYLRPGSRLTIDLASGTCESERLWRLTMQGDRQYRRRRVAVDAVYEAMLEAGKSIMGSDGVFDILMTGGWDSRGILALADRIGRTPRQCLSWGKSIDIPLTDASLGAELSRNYGIEHRFAAYDTDQFLENVDDWSYISELSTDNIGWYAEGCGVVVNEFATGADFMLTGDEFWGNEGVIKNEEEAVTAAYIRTRTPGKIRPFLNDELKSFSDDFLLSEVRAIWKDCDSDRWIDRKDFLYSHGRQNRFIFALGQYKELGTEVRRPFLSHHLLRVLRFLPPKYRHGRNAYKSVLGKHFPKCLQVPVRQANSLPNWKYDILTKPALRDFFIQSLDPQKLAGTSLHRFLNIDAVTEVRDRFFATKPSKPGIRAGKRSRIAPWVPWELRQRALATGTLARQLGLASLKEHPPNLLDGMRRIILLAALEKQFGRFTRTD